MVNKSKIAREFWRKIFKENQIDLRNSDARKQVVADFIKNNKGWDSTTSPRFFRLAFDKVSREFGMQTSKFGVKPEPARVKKSVGGISINAKTDEKKVHPLYEKDDKEKQNEQPTKTIMQNDLEQKQQAVQYSANSIGYIFATGVDLIHNRVPAVTPLSEAERIQLGEAWQPIFEEYFQTGSKWILPAIATIPILLRILGQYTTARKQAEMDKKYGAPAKSEPQKPKEKQTWDLHGKKTE